MAQGEHQYTTRVEWTGNRGEGTSGYRNYERAHEISAPGKPVIPGSSDPAFRGDRTRYNPEDLLVSSLSACHMLWYRRLFAEWTYAEFMPALDELLVDSRGNVWLRAFSVDPTTAGEWSVLDPTGRWLGQVETPPGLDIKEIGDDYVHLL